MDLRPALTKICRNFNSIKVQLESVTLKDVILLPSFQFHKGSIRIRLTESVSRQIVRFQFHKGSIRIQGTFTNLEKMKIFQFHKGSIRIKWHSRWGRW